MQGNDISNEFNPAVYVVCEDLLLLTEQTPRRFRRRPSTRFAVNRTAEAALWRMTLSWPIDVYLVSFLPERDGDRVLEVLDREGIPYRSFIRSTPADLSDSVAYSGRRVLAVYDPDPDRLPFWGSAGRHTPAADAAWALGAGL